MTGIIFDLDGTLLDTLADLHDAVNYALAALGYPARTVEEVRQFVGNGAGQLMARAVPAGVDPAPALALFREYYGENCRQKTGPYPGIPEALRELGQKYPLAIVSNKPDTAVKALCAEFFPGIYALGESPRCPRKPAPDMVYAAMEALDVTDCVYVGDSEVDVATAKNAAVPCLSVLWGFRDLETLENAGAQYFCHRPREIQTIIEEILQAREMQNAKCKMQN